MLSIDIVFLVIFEGKFFPKLSLRLFAWNYRVSNVISMAAIRMNVGVSWLDELTFASSSSVVSNADFALRCLEARISQASPHSAPSQISQRVISRML